MLLEMHAELSAQTGGRAALKKAAYKKLKAEGEGEIADLLMTFDAVCGERNMTVFNFQNNQIANANFGNQLGEITASFNALKGQDENSANFAEALKALTERVVN